MGIRRLTCTRGTTILEIVVALAIAGVGLALALPAFNAKPFNLAADMQDLTNNLQVARELATSRTEHYRLRVVSSTGYAIEGFNGVAWVAERTITLRANVQFTGGTVGTIAEFDTRGVLVAAAPPVVFTLQDTARGWTKQATVDAVGMVNHT